MDKKTNLDSQTIACKADKPVCNICGCDSFAGGPGGRLSRTCFLPRCEGCHSLERHRVYRKIFSQIVNDTFKMCSLLQFSKDQTVDSRWLGNHEVSNYGGDNSLDLQKINRDNGMYDIVMCNHVLEHVYYDNAALNELIRITKKDGFVFLTVPAPLVKEKTSDWGYPRREQHGHYRVYGHDFMNMLKRYLPNVWIVSKTDIDEVTKTKDIVFFLSWSKQGLKVIFDNLTGVFIIQEGSSF